MCPHRRTHEGGEEKRLCRSNKSILGLEHELQMTKLCEEYKDGFHLGVRKVCQSAKGKPA